MIVLLVIGVRLGMAGEPDIGGKAGRRGVTRRQWPADPGRARPRPGRWLGYSPEAPPAGVSWQSTQVRVDGLSRLDADAAVDGLDAVGAGDDGAQLEFGDLVQVVDHSGDPQQHVP